MPDNMLTPPDLYTKSDRVQLEARLQKLTEALEKGFERMGRDMAAMKDGLVAKTNRALTVAWCSGTLAAAALLVAVWR